MTDRNEREGLDGRPDTEPISCEEALAVVYEFLDGELPPARSDSVRRHLEVCRRCYPYFDFERLFLDYLRQAAAGEVHDEELEGRVRALLRTASSG